MDWNPLGTVVYHINRTSDIKSNGRKRETECEDEKNEVIAGERVSELAEEHDEHSYIGGEVDAFKIEVVKTVGGIVFGIDTFEAEILAGAGDEDEEELEKKDSPKKIEVNGDNKVVAPTVRKEDARKTLETTGGPKEIHVTSTNGDRKYRECDAD